MTTSTSVGARRLRARLAFLALGTVLSSGVAMPALAQAVAQVAPPNVRQPVDENDVDVIRGRHQPPPLDWVTIGPDGARGLALERIGGLSGFNSLLSAIQNFGGKTVVTIGGKADSFEGSGTFTPTEGNGATLTLAGGLYTYTSSQGMVAVFASNANSNLSFYYGELGRLASITWPDGTKYIVTHRVQKMCPGEFESGICNGGALNYVSRVQSVRTNTGYQLKPVYAYNPADTFVFDINQLDSWGTTTDVKAINNAVEFCDPAATSCSLTNSWPGTSQPPYFITTTSNAGLIATATNRGVTYNYSYSDSGNVRTTTITDPNSNSRVYTGDLTTFNILSYRDELSRTTSYQYDTTGRLTRVTAPEGNYVQYTYDARGNVTETRHVAKGGSGLADIVTSASYPSSCSSVVTCNKPASTTDARGNVTDYTYDTTHGGVLTTTLAAPTTGAIRPQTRYGYSQLSAYIKASASASPTASSAIWMLTGISSCQTLSSCSGSSDEVKTTIGYGPQSAGTPNNLLPVSVSKGAGDNSLTATTTAAYDDIGNPTYIDGPLSGSADTTRTIWNALRLPVGQISADPDGSGSLVNRAQRITYDTNRVATKVEKGTTSGQSDSAWSAFSASQQVDTEYDASARKTRDTVSAGGTNYAVQQYTYDVLGRVDCATVRMNPSTWSSLPSSACSLGTTGTYGPDRIVKTTYDAAGQATKTTSAYGTSDQADDVTAAYTSNGRVEAVIDAETNRTGYTYDGFDRVTQANYPSTTKGAGTSSSSDYEQLTYDVASNITARRLRDGSSIGYSYDANNRTTAKDLPGSEPDVTTTYDLLARPVSIASSAQTLTFGYDALGRLVSQGGALGTVSSQYDLTGRRTRLTWPDSMYVAYDYLVTGELATVRENGATSGVGVLATYSYDSLGRRSGVVNGNGTSSSVTVDPVSRLAGLSHDLAGLGSDVNWSLSYNPASQIANNARSNDAYAFAFANASDATTVNGLNQATASSGISVGYDGRGNTTAIGSNSYGYNSENLLTSGPASATLTYDPALRLYQTAGGTTTRFQYDGLDLVGEYNASNALQRRYVFGPGVDAPIVWYEGSGTSDRRWLHADERGSMAAVTDGAGNAIAVNKYDEYGQPASGNLGRFGYTGQTWLPELGQWYYKARMYAPSLGRFMQADPIGYGGGMNWYNYVGGDPVNLGDSLGLAANNERCDPRVCVLKQDPPPEPEGDIVVVTGNLREKPDPRPPELPRFLNAHSVGGNIAGGVGGAGSEKPQDEKPKYCSSIGYKIGDFVDSTLGGGAQNVGTAVVIGGVAVGAATAITGVGAGAGGAIAGGGGVIYAAGSALSAIGNGVKFLSGQSGAVTIKSLFSLPLTRLGPAPQIIIDKVTASKFDQSIPNPCQ